MTEQLVRCPFNPMHIMTESSLQRHIIRCMVNYPDYVTCPYNALHRFKNTELLGEHMLECTSKNKAHMFYEIKDLKIEQTCVHVDNIREFNLKEENWDNEL